MTIREDVMKGLDVCGKIGPCTKCPYSGIPDCHLKLKRDALDLLSECVPRVLTVEELHIDADEPAVCYIECRGKDGVYVTQPYRYKDTGWVIIPYMGIELTESCHVTEYGRKWRCWTLCPSEEQRNSMPWKEKDNEYESEVNSDDGT